MVDLHMHSLCSDGSDDLDALIENVNNSGVKIFALTDHDTAEGCRRILTNETLKQKLKYYGMNFIVGVEWTCVYGNQKMHILAYDFDPFDEKVINFEKKMRDMLDEKDKIRMDALENMGMKLSRDSKEYLAEKENVRSMDFAQCLVRDGYFDEVQQSFKECLNIIKYPFECRFDAVEVVKIMSDLGAKVVWAHSIYDVKRKITPFEEVERIINELKPYGLCGLECFYSLYSKDEIEKLVSIAKRNNLFITCGSDYHGQNKAVKIGQFSSDGINVSENIDMIERLNNVI